MQHNLDAQTVDGFGDEWERFDQSELSDEEHRQLFDNYFAIFPWDRLGADAEGFDLGCGSGRWAKLVAPRVGTLHCIDPSSAIEVARRQLAGRPNVRFHRAAAHDMPVARGSMDFGYSLGVLHHIPDTELAMRQAVDTLKPGAPFLVYLYYRFDNRPAWFARLWQASDAVRRGISSLPHGARYAASQAIALSVYWPLSRIARVGERMGASVSNWPLSVYRDCSVYTLRTDALDRFGTRLEQRFTRDEIRAMMERAGLGDIRFSDREPFWVAVGTKR